MIIKHRVLKKHRVCGKCKANEHNNKYCSLGYPRESVTNAFSLFGCYYNKPTEECPKPLTNQEFIESPSRDQITNSIIIPPS